MGHIETTYIFMCVCTHTFFFQQNTITYYNITNRKGAGSCTTDIVFYSHSCVGDGEIDTIQGNLTHFFFMQRSYLKTNGFFFFPHAIALSSTITDKVVVAISSLLWQNKHTYTYSETKPNFSAQDPAFQKVWFSAQYGILFWQAFVSIYALLYKYEWTVKCLEETSHPPKKCSNSHLEEEIFVNTIQGFWFILSPTWNVGNCDSCRYRS